MNYNQFKMAIQNKLSEWYGETAKVEIKEILKNNDVRRDVINITLLEGGRQNITPVLYLNEYYGKYVGGDLSVEEVVESITHMREVYDAGEVAADVTSLFLDWERVKNRIYPVLVAKDGNEEYLNGLVTQPYLDLEIIYCIQFREGEGASDGKATVKLTRYLFEQYGITETELYETALKNMRSDNYTVRNIETVVCSMMGMEDSGEENDTCIMQTGNMYVLTNGCKMYGAVGILNQELMESVSNGMDFYIIPSSVHETILVPYDETLEVRRLNEMVREVNATQVQPEEVLADHVYIYDASRKEVMKIGESNREVVDCNYTVCCGTV